MDDREMLQLAAKAVGLYVCSDLEHLGLKDWGADLWIKEDKYGSYRQWNPIENDGDAFRLMISARINIEFWDHHDSVGCYLPGSQGATSVAAIGNLELRRAIVRAAAEIG